MQKITLLYLNVAFLFLGGWPLAAQQPPTRKSCTVSTASMSAADTALMTGHFDEAENLFSALPPSSAATVGILRAKLGRNQLEEALALALKETTAHPGDALLMDALGEVYFRRGEVDEAGKAYNRSIALDPCLGRTHYDISRYQRLNGLYATARLELNNAHKLAPGDPLIADHWKSIFESATTPDENIARIDKELADTKPDANERSRLDARKKWMEAYQKGGCTLAQPVASTTIPLISLNNTGRAARGLVVGLNGKSRHLEVDTGASGFTLTTDAAKALGLTPEAEGGVRGFGDGGTARSFITHVDTIRIGTMEFHNCIVEVYERKKVAGEGDIVDGLIGGDVFRSFLLTLDYPGSQIKLSTLPRRPGDPDQVSSLETGPYGFGEDAPLNQKDRFVAPEMKNWVPVFRDSHTLIVPTTVNGGTPKLFVMDTGSDSDLLSSKLAGQISHNYTEDGFSVGVSGKVKLSKTGMIDLRFAGMHQQLGSMTATDLDAISAGSGVEFSGFIGYQTLRQMVISIDYRDNLISLVYKPHL